MKTAAIISFAAMLLPSSMNVGPDYVQRQVERNRIVIDSQAREIQLNADLINYRDTVMQAMAVK